MRSSSTWMSLRLNQNVKFVVGICIHEYKHTSEKIRGTDFAYHFRKEKYITYTHNYLSKMAFGPLLSFLLQGIVFSLLTRSGKKNLTAIPSVNPFNLQHFCCRFKVCQLFLYPISPCSLALSLLFVTKPEHDLTLGFCEIFLKNWSWCSAFPGWSFGERSWLVMFTTSEILVS